MIKLKKNEVCSKLILRWFVVVNTFSSPSLLNPQVVADNGIEKLTSELADNLRKN